MQPPLLQGILICPQCKSEDMRYGEETSADPESYICGVCGARYLVADSRPVLFAKFNAIFNEEHYRGSQKIGHNPSRLKGLVPQASTNMSVRNILGDMKKRLDARGFSIVLIVGGGRQRVWLDPLLNGDGKHRMIYCDVDKWADIDVFCDAHDLPFQNASVDAVVTTAVLEHVMYPEKAASEIARVLKTDGLLYSELPFMQQVHEGAYDFTRYTMSGHRRLFNHFAEIGSGLVSGPATALYWSIENFALAWTENGLARKLIKAVLRTTLFWVKYLDYPLRTKPAALDAASCTYFYGMKADSVVADSEIIAGYKGRKELSHV